MSFIDNVRKTTTSIGDIVKRTYGPLAPLNLPFNTGNSYRYPLDVGDARLYPHTVEFQAWLPTPVKLDDLGGGDGLVDKIKKFKDEVLAKGSKFDLGVLQDTPAGEYDGLAVNRNQRYNPRLLDFTRRAEKSDLIVMYMPNANWDDSVTSNYNKLSMTETFNTLGLAAEAVSSMAQGYKQSRDAGGGVIEGIVAGVKEAASSEAAAEVAGNMLGEGVADVGLAAMGYAKNPQEELLYGGTEFRSFQFEFYMTPRNRQEAQSVRDIIKRLKYHASPQFTDNQGRYLIPPSYFDISFKNNGVRNPNLPLISTCVMNNIRVNYSGGLDQWATYEDGMPIQVQMTLEFTELELMHKALREMGY